MTSRIQWAVTAALLTAFVGGLQMLSWRMQGEQSDASRQQEFELGLQQVATDWIVNGDAPATELGPGLPSALQIMRREGLDEFFARAPQSDRNLACVAALLIAFGAPGEAADYTARLVQQEASTEAIRRAADNDPPAWPEWSAALDDLPLPTSVRTRLQAWWFLHASSTQWPTVPATTPLDETAVAQRAELALASIQSTEGAVISRVKYTQYGLLAAGVFGIIGLFAIAPLALRLSRMYDGLLTPGPFSGELLPVYCAGVGWVAFGVAWATLSASVWPGASTPEGAPLWLVTNTIVTGAAGLWIAWAASGEGRRLRAADFGLTLAPFRAGVGGAVSALGWGALAYCVTVPLTAVTRLISEVIFGPAPHVTNPVIPLFAQGGALSGRVLLIAASVFLAPLFEEIFFRGYLYRALRDRMGPFVAALAVSVAFALLHPSAYTILPLIALSLGLCFLYESTGSLWPSVVVHALNNAGALLWLSATFAAG